MPFAIRKRKGSFAVVNKDTGSVKGTHKTKSAAAAQLRALYANVPEARGGKNAKRKK